MMARMRRDLLTSAENSPNVTGGKPQNAPAGFPASHPVSPAAANLKP
jgi:hypothetical protein